MNASQLTIYVAGLANDVKNFREAFDKLDKEHKQRLQALNDYRRELEKKKALLEQELDALKSEKAERKQERDDHILLWREVEDFKKWKDEQKKDRDEKTRRLWSFGPNIAGAVVTAVLSILISLATVLIVTYFKSPHP